MVFPNRAPSRCGTDRDLEWIHDEARLARCRFRRVGAAEGGGWVWETGKIL